MFSLNNKVAVLTGAGGGMGKIHAEVLSKQGARVVVTDIDESACLDVANQIKALGGNAIAIQLDVSKLDDIDRAIEETVNKFGRVDILVNNAGIFFSKPAFEITKEEWDKTITVNLSGQFFCAKRAAREMAKNHWGRIINIASIASGAGGVGVAGGSHYAASKAGVIGITKSLAVEWASLGITINAIAPALVETPMSASIPERVIKERVLRTPAGRIAKPEEISSVVVFLASEESGYITGSIIYVDGGRLST